MENLTAALLSCPIPASYALGPGDRGEKTSSTAFQPLSRLCAAASLAALSYPSTAVDASSLSERTPETLQERAVSSGAQALYCASAADLLLLQGSDPEAAAAAAAALAEDSAGLLLPAAGCVDQHPQQGHLELLRKALREHSLRNNTEACASSSSMSLRSVSTQASSLPDAAAAHRKRLLAPISSSSNAAGGNAAASVDSSQSSPFSSPSSSASPSMSSPPSLRLLARTAAANKVGPQEAASSRRSLAAVASAETALNLLQSEVRRPLFAEALAALCSSAVSVTNNSKGVSVAAGAAAAATSGGVGVGVPQQQQLQMHAGKGGIFGSCEVEMMLPVGKEAAATAAKPPNSTTTAAVAAHTSISAAEAAEALAKIFAADPPLSRADGVCVSRKGLTEAAELSASLSKAEGPVEEAAATEGTVPATLASTPLSDGAGKCEARIFAVGQKTATAAGESPWCRRDSAFASQDVLVDALGEFGKGEAKEDGGSAAYFLEAGLDVESIAAASDSHTEELAAVVATAGLKRNAAAASVLQNFSAAANGAPSFKPAGASSACGSPTAAGVATTSSDVEVAAAASASVGLREAAAAEVLREERTARKKRLRDSKAAGGASWGEEGVSPAAAAASAAAASAIASVQLNKTGEKATQGLSAAVADVGRPPAALSTVEGSSIGRKAAGRAAVAQRWSLTAENAYLTCRKKERRCGAAEEKAAAHADDGEGGAKGGTSAAIAGVEPRDESRTALATAAAVQPVAGNPLLQDAAPIAASPIAAAAGSAARDGRDRGESTTAREEGMHMELVDGDTAAGFGATAAAAAPTAAADGEAAAAIETTDAECSEEAAAVRAKKENRCDEELMEEGKPGCRGFLDKEQVENAAPCEAVIPEQIGCLPAIRFFYSGGSAAQKAALQSTGGGERGGDQECSTMSCNSRNSSGELQALSTKMNSDSLQQDLMPPQHVDEIEGPEIERESVAGEEGCSESVSAPRFDDEQDVESLAAAAGVISFKVDKGSCADEEGKNCSSVVAGGKPSARERHGKPSRHRKDKPALAFQKQQLLQQKHPAGADDEQQYHGKEQQQEDEEERALNVFRHESASFDLEDSSAFSVDETTGVPPLNAYKSLSWTEGFSLPLGKIGRQKLLRQVRLKYHRNRDHWRAKLHEKSFDVTSLPRMGVEQLWAVAHQMDLFDVACIIAHEHATRRQNRGLGGGGGGAGGGEGGSTHEDDTGEQQQDARRLPMCEGDSEAALEGGDAAAAAAGASLSESACGVNALVQEPPSFMQEREGSLEDLSTNKVLGNALALLADSTAAAAVAPLACRKNNSREPIEKGERRNGEQRTRAGGEGGATVAKESTSSRSSRSPRGSSQRNAAFCGSSPRARSGSSRGSYSARAAGVADGKAAREHPISGVADTAGVEGGETEEAGGEQGGGRGEGEAYVASLTTGAHAAAGAHAERAADKAERGNHPLALLLQKQHESQDDVQEKAEQDLRNAARRAEQKQTKQREELLVEEIREAAKLSTVAGSEHISHFFARQRATPDCGEKRHILDTCQMEEEAAAASAFAGKAAEAASEASKLKCGAPRRNKKTKMRQEQLSFSSSNGGVGELLSEVCAEALREAVACASDGGSRHFGLQSGSPSACLRMLATAEAAAAEQSDPAVVEAAAAAAIEEEATAGKAVTAETAATAEINRQDNLCEAALREVEIAAAADVCSRALRFAGWCGREGCELTPAVQHQNSHQQQSQDRQQQQQQENQRVDDLNLKTFDGESNSESAEELAKWCAAFRHRGEGRGDDSYVDEHRCCPIAASDPRRSDAAELALLLQQQFASATSSSPSAASGCSLLGDSELYALDSATAGAAPDVFSKEKVNVSPLEWLQHIYYKNNRGSDISGCGAARGRVVTRGRHRRQREKQGAEKDRQLLVADQRQSALKDRSCSAKQGHEDGGACIKMEESEVLDAEGDAIVPGRSKLFARGRLGKEGERVEEEATATPTASAVNPTAATAAGDRCVVSRGVSVEELGPEQPSEGFAQQSALEQQLLEEAAVAAAEQEEEEQEEERMEAEESPEATIRMQEAISAIYMHLKNELQGELSPPQKAADSDCRQRQEEENRRVHESSSVPVVANRCPEGGPQAATASTEQERRAVAAEAESKSCWVLRSGRKKNTVVDGGRVHPRWLANGDSSSSSSGGSTTSCCPRGRSNNESTKSRDTTACEETRSTSRRGIEGDRVCQRKETAGEEQLDPQLALRLQQQVNELQSQLNAVKMQVKVLMKLSGYAEELPAAVQAGAVTQHHAFPAGNAAAAAAAACETRSTLQPDLFYASARSY